MPQIKVSDIRAKFPMYSDLSDDQLLSAIHRKFYSDIPIGQFAKQIEYDTQRESLGKEAARGGWDAALAGAGKAVADIGRGAGQVVGLVDRNDVKESRKLDAPLMNTTAGQVGNFTGNAAALALLSLLPGANTLAGGSAIGAATGFLQPSESTSETLLNTVLGLVGGALVPAAQIAYRTGKAAVEPFYEKGKNAIVGRALERAAGKDSPEVIKRLEEAAAPFVGPQTGTPRATMGELVPGSVPTVGQASRNAGVAALERAATATNPEVTNAVSDIMQAQQAARRGLLEDMAGADGRRQFFSDNREATADLLYGAARRIGIDPAKLTPEALQNIAKFSQRIPDEVLNRARQLAKIGGDEMTDATSVKGMHWIKLGIDDMIGQAQRSGNKVLERQLVGLQKDLLTGLDQLSPAYAAARKTYAEMSKPINQMDLVQAIADKSVDKLTGNVRPGQLASAMTDQTAARATGSPRATLASVLDNHQLNQLNMLMDDVRRANAAQNLGRGVGSDTAQKLAYSNLLDASGMPTLLRNNSLAQIGGNLVGRVGDLAYDRANRELSSRLAQIMLDPAQAAALMRNATPAELNQLQQLLLRAAQAGGSGLALAAPATANAGK